MLPTLLFYPLLVSRLTNDFTHNAELEATLLHHLLEGVHLRRWQEVRELGIDTARDKTQIAEGISLVPCLKGTFGRTLGIPVLY